MNLLIIVYMVFVFIFYKNLFYVMNNPQYKRDRVNNELFTHGGALIISLLFPITVPLMLFTRLFP